MTSLLIATRNSHKVEEIRSILGERFRYLTLNDFPSSPVVIEDADTLWENARKKSIELAKWLSAHPEIIIGKTGETKGQLFVLADDSGLEVDALNGAPGVHSARFAARDIGAPGNSPDSVNNAKLLRMLAKVPAEKRSARFRCVVSLTRVNYSSWTKKIIPSSDSSLESETVVFEGTCEGRIAEKPQGTGGFGYDTLFLPEGYDNSFAGLSPSVKNKLSHRAQALEKLRKGFR